MSKTPYIILEIEENATEAQIRAAHSALRAKYTEQLFKEGQEGEDASRKLSEIDAAYQDALEILRRKGGDPQSDNIFAYVDALIRDGKIDEAGRELGRMDVRSAEWHYYQAMVFYKQDWVSDSIRQLELAISIAPDNKKYSDTLEKMKANAARKEERTETLTGEAIGNINDPQQTRAGYQDPQGNFRTQPTIFDQCCNCCGTLCCMSMCCNCNGC